jgi:hypothetical protein
MQPVAAHSRLTCLTLIALAGVAGAQGQPVQAPAQQGPAQQAGAPQGPRPGGRGAATPRQTDRYRSTLVKLGGNAVDGLLYEPLTPGRNARVAVLYSNANFGFELPASELANRGYRVLFVPHPPAKPGRVTSPLDGFEEASRGITYLRSLPGVERVVAEGWGSGAVTMTLYADVAAHGPAACQTKGIIWPCETAQASNLAKPDGLILFDPGLGSGSKVSNIDPAYNGNQRTRADLDMFAAANGYDINTGTAKYSAEFRERYFAAQSARNDAVIDQALARVKALDAGKDPGADEPLLAPGGANVGDVASLHHPDVSLISHTKRPYTLLKADGSKPTTILRTVRPSTGPVGADALAKVLARNGQPARAGDTVRDYLANDAIRTTRDFALTEDDVVGVDWKSSNTGTPAQAEGVSVPALVMTNTCFQFIVASEIVYDHLASKDKTFAGVEGSEHFFTPCEPQYGNTTQRLFDYVEQWLGKTGRF